MELYTATKVIVLCLVTLALAVPSLAAIYPVTWTKSNLVAPATLLQLSKLHPGDTINFLNTDTLPIYQVSKAAYDGCLFTNDNILLGRQRITVFTIPEAGDFYLICDPLDCQEGLKLELHAS
nr:uncharacterized protein LOC113710998 [Coffea arabica]